MAGPTLGDLTTWPSGWIDLTRRPRCSALGSQSRAPPPYSRARPDCVARRLVAARDLQDALHENVDAQSPAELAAADFFRPRCASAAREIPGACLVIFGRRSPAPAQRGAVFRACGRVEPNPSDLTVRSAENFRWGRHEAPRIYNNDIRSVFQNLKDGDCRLTCRPPQTCGHNDVRATRLSTLLYGFDLA